MAVRIRPFNLLLYFSLLALSAAGAYLLNSRFGYTPLLFLLLLMPLDALCARRARRRLHSLSLPNFLEAERGSPAVFSFAYENGSPFLICHLSIALRLTGPKGSRPSNGGAVLNIAPKAKETLGFSAMPGHIGVYQVRMQGAAVYGPLGLFSMKLPAARPAVMVITPSRGQAAAYESDTGSGRNESAARMMHDGQNTDSYNGVREYAPGDLLRSIHWKLTAHSSKMMTRLYEEDEEGYVTVAADLRPVQGAAAEVLCIHDQLCESAYRSVCNRVGQGEKVRLVFFEGDRLRSLRVKSEADLPEAAAGLASAGPSLESLADAPEAFPISGEMLIVSAHLDAALVRELGDFSGGGNRAIYLLVAPARFERKDSSVYLDYLMKHDVDYTIIKAEQARRTQKVRLQITQVSADTGEKNERIFRRK